MPQPKLRYRSIFISDLHLGAAGCQTKNVHDFLRYVHSDRLYLVGDIVDLWIKPGARWSQACTNVIRTILGKAKRGTQVYYTPGNHDEWLRKILGAELGNILIQNEFVHETANGQHFLVTHGDLFDGSVNKKRWRWLALLGTKIYEKICLLNSWLNHRREENGKERLDLGKPVKTRLKSLVKHFNRFEERLSAKAKHDGVDGVICGHIHQPIIRENDGLTYVNTGDWVENGTAIVEHYDGRLELVYWDDLKRVIKPVPVDEVSVAELIYA
ncbi:MAG: UDP-2,3-diacylglucosamine diphosphatase [Fimbriimonadaceae bacterium]